VAPQHPARPQRRQVGQEAVVGVGPRPQRGGARRQPLAAQPQRRLAGGQAQGTSTQALFQGGWVAVHPLHSQELLLLHKRDQVRNHRQLALQGTREIQPEAETLECSGSGKRSSYRV
jgi:hypothetical protein